MASSRTFNGVTRAVFDCVKARSAKEHDTVYEPAGASSGVATTKTIVGTVKLGYEFASANEQITYTIHEKPFLAPESEIWAGISNTIGACGGKAT
jgi:hypothetical protein